MSGAQLCRKRLHIIDASLKEKQIKGFEGNLKFTKIYYYILNKGEELNV